MAKIRIDGRAIGPSSRPYIVAELSANHNGSLDTAFRLIEAGKKAGADAIKIQTYRPDTITLKSELPDFQITEGLWKGHTLWDLYAWAHTPWEWHADLFAHARKVGITLFSSPFDTTAVDLLEDLGSPAYKVASFEAVDLPLIRYIASTGKPMIISTGMADAEEIGEAVEAARDGGCRELILLHCVSGYPAPANDYNLRTIPDMIARFGTVVGLSDHTLTNATAVASVALGASMIEKHVTLDRSAGGPDDSFSLEPEELGALCSDTRTAWESMGKIDYSRKKSEKISIKFRRSLYYVTNMKKGDTLTKDNVRSIRPGYGLSPKLLYTLVGKRLRRDVSANTPVRARDF